MIFKTIQQELYCLFNYGTTSFGLIQRLGISVIRWSDEQQELLGAKAYSACSGALHSDYGHNGFWAEGDTPFEALIACVHLIDTEWQVGNG